MTLPPLVDISALEARLGRSLTSAADIARAEAVLIDSSGIIRAVTRRDFLDVAGTAVIDLPDEVAAITLRLAVTAFTNPRGIRQESIGGYSYTFAGGDEQAGPGSALTEFEKRILGFYRSGQTKTPSTYDVPVYDESWVNGPTPAE